MLDAQKKRRAPARRAVSMATKVPSALSRKVATPISGSPRGSPARWMTASMPSMAASIASSSVMSACTNGQSVANGATSRVVPANIVASSGRA